MSQIDGKHARYWIRENHPENGSFRVYWKDVVGPHEGSVTLDPDEGEGLRYEWYYKNGKQHGISKGWWPNGELKSKWNYKDGKLDGLHTLWYQNGQKKDEETYKDGKYNGLYNIWYKNGRKPFCKIDSRTAFHGHKYKLDYDLVKNSFDRNIDLKRTLKTYHFTKE